jgi:hypothetical protein
LPSLEAALGNGQLQFFDKGPVALRLRFADNADGHALCDSYRETPIAADQRIVKRNNGTYELQATVMYSLQLVRMLQAEAHRSYVVEPQLLREEIAGFVRQAAALHLSEPELVH